MQTYSFLHDNFSDEKITGQIILIHSFELIGTYEMYVNDEVFVSAINIFPDFQKLGIGFAAFKFCFDKLNETNNLKYFFASWNMDAEYSHLPNSSSINLTKFFKLVDSGIDKAIALWQTPTGKWLKKLGFDKVSLNACSREAVRATYFK